MITLAIIGDEAICSWTLAKLHRDESADCFVARLFLKKEPQLLART